MGCNHADFLGYFLSGVSAGATIEHYVGMHAIGHGSWQFELEERELKHVCLQGMLLFHPFFTCEHEEEPPPLVAGWAKFSNDHSLVDPLSPKAPPLAAVPLFPACIFVGGDDALNQSAIEYCKELVQAEKKAKLSIAEGETHVFHILKPASPNVIPVLNEAKNFISQFKHSV
ncbi:hypothetical protein L7F22_049557 [Adiantum nelumboides]|nr:hypothetical protein [Adiantum nelumboides]